MRARIWLLWMIFLAACQTTLNTPSREPPPVSPSAPAPVVTILTATPPPAAPPTLTPQPTQTPTPTPLPRFEEIIGQTEGGASILAEGFGRGALKVVVLAETPAVLEPAITYYQTDPERVPPDVQLWLVSQANPAGQPVWTDFDTNLDGCVGNNWFGDSQLYPFSLAAARAVRDFTADAWAVILLNAGEQSVVQVDSCRQLAPGIMLATGLAQRLATPVTPLSDVTGHLIDYLAGEGIAAARVTIGPDADQMDLLAGVLADAPGLYAAESAALGAAFKWLNPANSGRWAYAPGSFLHPLGLTLLAQTVYLIDGGRVLALDGRAPAAPQVILRPGDNVAGVRVQEPLDAATDGSLLYVLDRVGDVYAYEPATQTWTLDRYDRPVRDISSHYYVALEAAGAQRWLLETSYPFALAYSAASETLWSTPEGFGVDIGRTADTTYILLAEFQGPTGMLMAYRDGVQMEDFRPNFPLFNPRQVSANGDNVTVLDRDGARLLAFDAHDGRLLMIAQFDDHSRISTFWRDGAHLWLAGRDSLYFVDEPQRVGTAPVGETLSDPQPHDLILLNHITGLRVPLGIADFNQRPYQMPGAPRHYRLGVHEGLDFYWQPGAFVLSAGAGVVSRATWDYVTPAPAAFDFWRAESQHLGYTSPEAHDFYRGRQVWIDHGQGVTTRYVHLSAIDPTAMVGAPVSQGQIIAQVGNSGSPSSLESEESDAHLHFEIRVGAGYVGQFLRPIETRDWLRRILH